MFKNLFKSKHAKEHQDHHDSDRFYETSTQPVNPGIFEEIHDKPFAIELENLDYYDLRELHGFIKKYEQFTNIIKNKYNEMLGEYSMTKEKLSLLEQERRRLVLENNQYKSKYENTPKSPIIENYTPSPKSQFIIQKIMNNPFETNDKSIEELHERVNKLIEDLHAEKVNFEAIKQSSLCRDETTNDSGSEPKNTSEKGEETQQEPEDSEAIISKPTEEDGRQSEDDIVKPAEAHNEGTIEAANSEALNVFVELGAEFKKMVEEFSKAYHSAKLEEMKRKKEEIIEKIEKEELERANKELKLAIEKVETTLGEVRAELEIAKMEAEDREGKLQEMGRDSTEESLAVQQELEDIKAKFLQKEKDELEAKSELEKLQITLKEVEENKEKWESKLNKLETKFNDTENALIQEKLKHHQTVGDLNRANEKIQELERDLNEEVEARKGDVFRNEELKKHIVEMERKMKELRIIIKKLNDRVLELENKETQEKIEKIENYSSYSQLHDPSQNQGENSGRSELINTQLIKIRQLEERLDEVLKQVTLLQESNNSLREENEALKTQNRVLQEKREVGLKEIKRLSLMLEQSPHNESKEGISSSHERRFSQMVKTTEVLIKPVKILSNNPKRNKPKEDLANLKKIKTGLEEVYKGIIMAITNEKLNENVASRKPTGKLGELVKGPLPSEIFMKIEKKMNDNIVLFQEYMENFE